jgi:predicted metal-binding membrane protein
LRRDRAIVSIALAIVTLLAWLYVLRLAADMDMGGMDMAGMRMVSTGINMVMTSRLQPWTGAEFALMFVMWSVMMVAMMLPSATPMVLLYARVGRTAAIDGEPFAPTGWFAAGYLLVWLGFAFGATGAQWALERAALLTPMMESASGCWRRAIDHGWSLSMIPIKGHLFSVLPSPPSLYPTLRRLSSQRPGRLGDRGPARRLLCWMLLGVDDVVVRRWGNERVWIGAIAGLVLPEKVAAGERLVSRAAGTGLILGGVWLLMRYPMSALGH